MANVKSEDVETVKKREAYIAAELYRVFRNSLDLIGKHQSGWFLRHVLPEYPVNDEKADLIVMGPLYREMKPLLVIETKQRVYNRIGPSLANAVRQVEKYAKKLGSRYFAVYDGWMFLLFDSIHPYLVGVFSASIESELTEQFARRVLIGLLDLSYSNKKDELDQLSKFRDKDFLFKKVLPSIANMLSKERVQPLKESGIEVDGENEKQQLLEKWRNVLSA